jgi:hypothetical protein
MLLQEPTRLRWNTRSVICDKLYAANSVTICLSAQSLKADIGHRMHISCVSVYNYLHTQKCYDSLQGCSRTWGHIHLSDTNQDSV